MLGDKVRARQCTSTGELGTTGDREMIITVLVSTITSTFTKLGGREGGMIKKTFQSGDWRAQRCTAPFARQGDSLNCVDLNKV